MGIKNDNIIFTAAQAINEICAPLKTHLGISQFCYNKLYTDGAEIDLATCPEMIQNYRDKELHQYSIYGAHPKKYETGYVLWSQVPTHEKILDARAQFQVNDGITFINKMDDGVEFFHFETAEIDSNKI